MSDMTRREFIALVGGAGLLLAVKVRRARAQQSAKIPRIGIIDDSATSKAATSPSTMRTVTGYQSGSQRPRQRSFVARWMSLRPTPRPRAWRPSKPPTRFLSS